MTKLRTERLVLRPFERQDAVALFEIFSDPAVMRYWSSLPHTCVQQTEALIEETIEADPATTSEFIVERNGVVIGKAGFWKVPEVGFLFHPSVWGQGIAAEALRAVIAFGFDVRRLDRITADVDPDNSASLRLLAKLGFVETGRAQNTFKIGKTWVHSVYLSLDAT